MYATCLFQLYDMSFEAIRTSSGVTDDCAQGQCSSCPANGTCVSVPSGAPVCQCPPGFRGAQCEIRKWLELILQVCRTCLNNICRLGVLLLHEFVYLLH